MTNISINNSNYEFHDTNVINLVEGLIGLPGIKRAVLVEDPEFAPFSWFASLDDESNRFIVVDPKIVFRNLDIEQYLKTACEAPPPGDEIRAFILVNVSSNWENTTFNLRAPILVNQRTQKAVQVILSNTDFQLAEGLPE